MHLKDYIYQSINHCIKYGYTYSHIYIHIYMYIYINMSQSQNILFDRGIQQVKSHTKSQPIFFKGEISQSYW